MNRPYGSIAIGAIGHNVSLHMAAIDGNLIDYMLSPREALSLSRQLSRAAEEALLPRRGQKLEATVKTYLAQEKAALP